MNRAQQTVALKIFEKCHRFNKQRRFYGSMSALGLRDLFVMEQFSD